VKSEDRFVLQVKGKEFACVGSLEFKSTKPPEPFSMTSEMFYEGWQKNVVLKDFSVTPESLEGATLTLKELAQDIADTSNQRYPVPEGWYPALAVYNTESRVYTVWVAPKGGGPQYQKYFDRIGKALEEMGIYKVITL
jgi:hypothetical protein